MNRFFGYVKSMLGNADMYPAPEETTAGVKKDLHANMSGIQDQFTFLYDNFDNYRKDKNSPVDFTYATQLVKKHFVDPNSGDDDCVYRGMGLSIDAIRNIYEKGMLLKDLPDQDDPEFCFTGSDPFFSQRTIQRASQESPDHVSCIFEVPMHLLKQYGIQAWGGGDKFTVHGDIPSELIQQCRIFVVDYKNQDLIEIGPHNH